MQMMLYDYPTAVALDGLYWLRDGVTEDEVNFLVAIVDFMANEIDKYGYVHREGRWLRPPEGQPLPHIVGIPGLEWVGDGISDYEVNAIEPLMQRRNSIERIRNELNLPISSIAWSESTPEFMFGGITESKTVLLEIYHEIFKMHCDDALENCEIGRTVYSQPSVNVPKWMLSQPCIAGPRRVKPQT